MNDGTQTKLAEVEAIIDDRFAALDADLRQYIGSWIQTSDERKVLANVAKELREFLAQRKVDIESLFDDTSVQQLHIKNTLLSSYIDKALADWQDLKRVATQREFYAGRADQNPFTTLKKADELARLGLGRAEEAGLIDKPPTPICYFEKNIAITESPYTTLPLISVPLTAISLEIDLYAVVHEIGHYVFTYLNKSAKENIVAETKKDKYNQPYRHEEKAKDNLVSKWTEEIFADLFASLVGGKKYDEQFEGFLLGQAVLLQNISIPNWEPINEFLRDDQDHPPIFLRPLLLKDNLEWEQIVGDVLSGTLSDEENKQFAALQKLIKKQGQEGEARNLCRSIAVHITKVSGDKPISFPVQAYTGPYVYEPKTKFDPLGELADFIKELQEWNREQFGSTILRCCM